MNQPEAGISSMKMFPQRSRGDAQSARAMPVLQYADFPTMSVLPENIFIDRDACFWLVHHVIRDDAPGGMLLARLGCEILRRRRSSS